MIDIDQPAGPAIDQGFEDYLGKVREFTSRWAGQAPSWERAGHLPPELFADAGESGLFADRWRPGPRAGLPMGIALTRNLAEVNGGASLAVSLHSEAFVHALHIAISRWGCDFEATYEAALRGLVIGCLALTEPTGGSDAHSLRTLATPVPGGWQLRGEKRYITNAGVATHAIVFATVEGTRREALGAFLVSLNAPGVERVGYFPTLGLLASDTTHLRLDTFVPSHRCVGSPGRGLVVLMGCLQFERVSVSAQLLAAASISFQLSRSFLRRRVQFGSRLIEMQALRHRLADCWTDLCAAEALFHKTVSGVIGGTAGGGETAVLKLNSARVAARLADEALQFFGGRGYTSNYPLERIYRDVRLGRIGGGTDEIMREIIGSSLDVPDAPTDALLDRLDAEDHAYLT